MKFHRIVERATKHKNREALKDILSDGDQMQHLKDIVKIAEGARLAKQKLGETPTAEKTLIYKLLGNTLSVLGGAFAKPADTAKAVMTSTGAVLGGQLYY